MILLHKLSCALAVLTVIAALEYPGNPISDASDDVHHHPKESSKSEHSEQDESGLEVEVEDEGTRDKHFLDAALKTVLDPNAVIMKTNDAAEEISRELQQMYSLPKNTTIENFIEEMDNLSLEICKTSQEALWSYVTDTNNEAKKNSMVRVAAEDDEVKKLYWTILKTHYLNNSSNDPKLSRKLRIIKERGISIQDPKSHSRWMIDSMQKIWSEATVCAYNSSSCDNVDKIRALNDIKKIFKSSNDTKELAYYWKAYRDITGKRVRLLFKDHILMMNLVAKSENFSDAGEMWRFAFEDEDFVKTVDRLWSELKPLYDVIHDYVRFKLKSYYKDDLAAKDSLIPAHLLGNLWAQEWQSIYPKVIAYPETLRPKIENDANIGLKEIFDIVDEFHKSLGFKSANDSYQDVAEITASTCLPSSHDMCDGVNYKIQWCGQNITDVTVGLTKAARLLGHIQYFKHYKDLEPLYRDGPNPAFHDAISDMIAVQVSSPEHLKTLNAIKMDNKSDEVSANYLLWLGLDKLPLIGYAYVLDKWRWDVFANRSLTNLNEHWWELRTRETAISAPIPRDEDDLDPAAKYHVVSDIQYISYLISNVLEFQILKALCMKTNHTGPLHKCSLYGSKEAGKMLSDGMSLGASEDWRTVLKTMTGQTELSTEGILEYFAPLTEFLREENARLSNEDMDSSTPMIVGAIVAMLTVAILALYCVKKHRVGWRVLSLCGLSKNGSLDIVTNEMQSKAHEMERIAGEKVL